MARRSMTIVMKDYDYLTPLLTGECAVEDIDLTIDRKTLITQVAEDRNVPAGEFSFSRFLIMWAEGNRDFVAIPFFCYRAFRQRCFFVARGSPMRALKDLAGKRVGT